MTITYRVTMNGTTVASGLTAGQLMASDWQDEPDAQIDEEIAASDAAAAAIESLRAFAEQHGEIQFAHLCTAALTGEQWALDRIAPALDKWRTTTMAGKREALRLAAIRSTDTTRPDGAIARAAVEI